MINWMYLSVDSSELVTGTTELLNDISRALLVIAPIVAAVALIFMGIRRMMSDEHEIPMWNKRMIGVVVALVIAICASGLISVITSYYR